MGACFSISGTDKKKVIPNSSLKQIPTNEKQISNSLNSKNL